MSDLTTMIIVGLIAIITNLTLGGMVISSVFEWLLALGFKKTQGSVVLSKVRKWGGSLQANIHYTYQVNGQTYTGSKIHPGTVIGGRGVAYNIQKRYPVGETVTVHYAPMFPAWALLEVTLSHIVVLLIILVIGNLAALWVIFPVQFNNVDQMINWVSKTITG